MIEAPRSDTGLAHLNEFLTIVSPAELLKLLGISNVIDELVLAVLRKFEPPVFEDRQLRPALIVNYLTRAFLYSNLIFDHWMF